ncbi:MAG: T9SS type A sorting domain-containing protein [candidate division Zixibacteria bacterium]|nr:T9SS type A sorting domain-containing protein [candidate division Zixibacteria bacterium]
MKHFLIALLAVVFMFNFAVADEVFLYDDFEDGDFTDDPEWSTLSEGNGNGTEDWAIYDDPWTYSWGTVTHNGSGFLPGSDSDGGTALADEYLFIDFDTDGLGEMTLTAWIHFRGFQIASEYFLVMIDDDVIDSIFSTAPFPDDVVEGDYEYDITDYNDGETHTLTFRYYADFGYIAALDDVAIETDYQTSVDDETVPEEFELLSNYPNPFNAQTNITFNLPEASNVTLDIYNTLGQKIDTVVNDRMDAGQHTVSWDAGSLSSGVYFYKLTAGEEEITRKMNLLK